MVGSRLRKGAVLIVAIGVMTVLAVLGFVFLTTTRVERAISRNYVDLIRAKLYAQSGLELAVGQIQDYIRGTGVAPANYSIAEGSNVPWYYAGSTNQGPATPIERARLVSFPYPDSTNPVYVGIADLETPDVPTSNHGVSYFFTGTYSQDMNNNPADGETHGDYAAVKVTECGGQIYINGEDDLNGSDPAKPLPDNIRMLLNSLAAVLQQNNVTCPHGEPISGGLQLGDRIRDIKVITGTPRSIVTKASIMGSAYPYLTEHDYEIVSPYLTTHAWVDKTTLDPRSLQHVRPHDPTLHYQTVPNATYCLLDQQDGNGLAIASAKTGGLVGTVDVSNIVSAMREIVFASCASDRLVSDEYSHSVYHYPAGANDHWSTFPIGQEAVAPSPGNLQMAVIQCRAPININSAHRHVIEACLRGLAGTYLDRPNWWSTYSQPLSSGTIQAMWQAAPQWSGNGYTVNQLVTIPNTLAAWIADQVIAARNSSSGSVLYPFRAIHHWKQFDDFIDYLSVQGAWTGATPNHRIREAQKRIVKANANPNSRINKWNPDLCRMPFRTLPPAYLPAYATPPQTSPGWVAGQQIVPSYPNGLWTPPHTQFGDTDKADLTSWTTEFCFRSNGYFEIESMGRVLGPYPTPGGLRQIVAEQKVCVLAKVYDVLTHNTQRDFVHNMIGGGQTQRITTYPESIADPSGGGGDLNWSASNPTYKYFGPPSSTPHYCNTAEFDGYFMPDTVDKYAGGGTATFFRDFTSSFGQWAQGTAEEDRSIVAPEGNPSRGSQSELFPDGVFFHQTRRYPNYQSTPSQSKCYGGAVGQNSNIDEFIRYAPFNNVLGNFLGTGTIEFWFKPTWTFSDIPQNCYGNTCGSDGGPFYQSWTHVHPTGEGGYCFMSSGYANEDSQGHSAGIWRMAIFARQVATNTGRYSSEVNTRHIGVTRGDISGVWNQNGAPFNGKAYWNDICPIWGWTYYIAYFLPTNGGSGPGGDPPLDTLAANPMNWGHPHKWHHIVLLWSGATSYILCDGYTSGPTKGSITAQSILSPPNNHSVFIGSNRFKTNNTNGHPNNCDGTIDMLKVYGTMAFGTGGYFPPPHRYAGNSVYNGYLIQPTQAMASGAPSGRVANASWTVWFPANQQPAAGATQQSSIVVTLQSTGPGGTFTSVPTGGSDPSCGRGLLLGLELPAGNTLTYRVECNIGGTWITSAPIIDDFSVAIALAAPKYYYYYFSN